MQRLVLFLAGVAGAAAVWIAAAAAHGDPAQRPVLDAVAMILGWQAPALLALGLWNRRAGLVGALFIGGGAALFAVALLLGLFGGVALGPMAPVGGVLMIAGWIWIAGLALKPPR